MARMSSVLLLHIALYFSGEDSFLSPRERRCANAFLSRRHKREKLRLEAVAFERDHAHILVNLRPAVAARAYVKRLKAATARWVNRRRKSNRRFRWRHEVMTYTVSRARCEAERRIVNGQWHIHKKRDAEAERKVLLRRQRLGK